MVYICCLNGVFYGVGNLRYMNELFNDYVVLNQMYGAKECKFEVKELEYE